MRITHIKIAPSFRFWLCLPLTIVAVVGCSSVTYHRILTQAEDTEADGIRYFDTSPYILVQQDTNANWSSSMVYLPDHTKKSQVNIVNFLAVNNTTLVFTNGILTDTSASTDSSAVPAAIVQAASQAALGLIGAGEKVGITSITNGVYSNTNGVQPLTLQQLLTNNPMPTNVASPAVFLFKIVKVHHQWGLVGASAPDLDLVNFSNH